MTGSPSPAPRTAAPALLLLLASAFACSRDANAPPSADGGVAATKFLSLEAGEAAEIGLEGDTAKARIATTGGDRFVVVLASTKLDNAAGTHPYSVAMDALDSDTGSRKLDGCAIPRWSGAPAASDKEPAGPAPKVGDVRSLTVSAVAGLSTIDAKVVAVGSHATVWVDTTNPTTLDPAFVDDFLTDFDKTILPRERALFGMESDIDGDGRIGLVFTPLTKDTAVAFFLPCDVVEFASCNPGNHGEYLYLTPPDAIAPPYNTPAAIKETLAHELGHLVHFNRKVLRNKLTSWPDGAYMIEGFGGFTQDVSGYQAGNFYVAQAGLQKIDDFSLADVFGARPNYDTKRDGLLRGGAYWLVRYLYDRGGGDAMEPSGAIVDRGGPSFVRALLDSPDSIATKLATFTGGTLSDVAVDFYTALAMSNGAEIGLANPKNACFAFEATAVDPVTGKSRGGDPYGTFHGQAMGGAALQKAASPDGKLRSGGVEYLTIDVAAGQKELDVTLTVAAAAAPRVRIARVK